MKFKIEASIHTVPEIVPDPETQREIEASVLRAVRHLESQPHHLLGEGASAKVYFPEKGLPNTCYKVLRDNHYPVVHAYNDTGKEKIPPIYKAHFDNKTSTDLPWSLSIEEEVKITNKVALLGQEADMPVDVPLCYHYFKLAGEVDRQDEYYISDRVEVVLMDRMKGKDLDQIVFGKLPLPSNFDPDAFIDKLKTFLDFIHSHGIYHRDIALRNIMVDDQGNPKLIDFGRATDTTMGEDPYRAESMVGDSKIVRTFTNDDHMLEEVRKSLREYHKFTQSPEFAKK
ncbi:MAG: protein kinase [Patescibacteria group bacterium]